ncbi:hypothetical protein M3Y96_00624900 [Aphelenchoides besseyi]|nr:hypothetical protein M3Y96_00624900 [Aphelenchoides besseyi]
MKITKRDTEDDCGLEVFGYTSKLFSTDELEGRTEDSMLIPWQGDEDLLIDRYDCRLYLTDLSEKTLGQSDGTQTDDDAFTDAIEEELCEVERWLSLKKSTSEQKSNADSEKQSKGAEIAFSYEKNETTEEDDGISDESDDESNHPYEPPKTLKIPVGTNMPSTLRLGHLIERTARFVAMNGNQMEIIIKAKHRKHNERFDFLEFDNPLNPFYKFLCKAIREKKWIPPPIKPRLLPGEHTVQPRPSPQTKEEKEDETDSDDSDGGYLHPLLLARSSARSSINSPSFPLPPPPISKPLPVPTVSVDEKLPPIESDPIEVQNYELWHKSFYGRPSPFAGIGCPPLTTPPADILSQINVSARFVAANGEFAERRLLEHNNGRLDFLYPDNKYLIFYHNRVRYFQTRLNPSVMPFVRSKYHIDEPGTSANSRIQSGFSLPASRPPVPPPPEPPIQTRKFPEEAAVDKSNDEAIKQTRKERARQYMAELLRTKNNNSDSPSEEVQSKQTKKAPEIVVPADIAVPRLISTLIDGQLHRIAGANNRNPSLEQTRSRDPSDSSRRRKRSRSRSRERRRRSRSSSRKRSHRHRSRSRS